MAIIEKNIVQAHIKPRDTGSAGHPKFPMRSLLDFLLQSPLKYL